MLSIDSKFPALAMVAAVPFVYGARLCPAEELPREFFAAHCVDCHDAEQASAGIRLDNAHLRDWSEHSTSLLFERVLKALDEGKMPPEDVSSITGQQRQAAVESLHAVLMQRSGTQRAHLRRLTRREYENTIGIIFGIDFQTPAGFPPDRSSHGFNNLAESLVVSPPLMEAYYHAAIAVADRMIPPSQRPIPSVRATIPADELVISYSSGAVIDGTMRLATRTNTVFRSCTWPEKYEVRTAGTYRITVTASRFAPPSKAWPKYEQPMTLQVRARSRNNSGGESVDSQRLLAEFEVTEDAPAEFSCVAELQPAETPFFYFANAPVTGDRGDNRGLEGSFAKVLRTMFENDPRLLAGWLKVKHGRGLRGGLGWQRVKMIRDSKDLDLSSIDMSEKAVKRLLTTMTKDPRQYAESVVYQFFEQGPALEIHGVDIEGPLKVIQTPEEKRQQERTRRFLGQRGDESDDAYVRGFLRKLITQAFRRPATDADVDRYATIVRQHVEQGHTLEDGLHLVIRTVLMSPKFLYRGGRTDSGSDSAKTNSPGDRRATLDNFELAARLSYFLTGGPPDETLFAAAKSGDLSDPEKLTQQARRLLKSPELNRFIADFTRQWLETKRLDDIMPDARLMPGFTAEHREAMITETELFFAEILRENLPLEAFIKPDFTFLNKRLAEDIYGRKDVRKRNQNFVRVSLKPASPYGGLLGQASVMMATANGVDTQPVVRGVWVLENILGDPPPPPPDSVPALTPDTSGAKTVRQLLAAHRSDARCATCHRRIDPPGLILENFDAVGRWRTHYPVFSTNANGKTLVKDGKPVDAAAELPGGVVMKDVDDLRNHVVANIEQFANCLSQKLLTYATGHPTSYREKLEIQHVVAANRARGNRFGDLLLDLIRSRTFRSY